MDGRSFSTVAAGMVIPVAESMTLALASNATVNPQLRVTLTPNHEDRPVRCRQMG
jgi:hypothetical protein